MDPQTGGYMNLIRRMGSESRRETSMSDTDYNKCICETCGGNCGCDAEIERLRDSNEVLTEQVKRMDAEVERAEAKVAGLASLFDPAEIRKWWRFDEYQNHTHSWHDREDFIERIRQALTDADVECVRGWVSMGRQLVIWDEPQDFGEQFPCTIIYHKEKP